MPDAYSLIARQPGVGGGGLMENEYGNLMRQAKQQQLFSAMSQIGGGLMQAGMGGPWGSQQQGIANAFKGLSQQTDPMDLIRARYMMGQIDAQKTASDTATAQAAAQRQYAAMTPEQRASPEGQALAATAAPSTFMEEAIEGPDPLSSSDLVKVPDPAGGFRYIPATEAVGQAGYEKPPDILNPDVEAARIRIAREGAPRTSIDMKGETKFVEKLGELGAKNYADIQETAQGALGSNQSLDQLEQSLEGIYTGAGGQTLQGVRKVANLLGLGGEELDQAIAKGEVAEAISNRLALEARKPVAGGGMPGSMSDTDREFLRKQIPNLLTSPEGRRVLIEAIRRKNSRALEISRLADEYVATNDTMTGFNQALRERFADNPESNLFDDLRVPDASRSAVAPAVGDAGKMSDAEIKGYFGN